MSIFLTFDPMLFRKFSARTILLLALLSLALTGCFEIVEDITVHADGTGTFSYSINMSQSKSQLDGIMKLDSSDGYRVPKKSSIMADIETAKKTLNGINGISAVSSTADWVNYIFNIKFNFNSVQTLNTSLEALSEQFTSDHKRIPEASDNFFWTGKGFERRSHYDAKAMAPKLGQKDKDILRKATYTCIYRFDGEVQSCSNTDAQISKNGKSVMLRLNMLQLAQGDKTMINAIKLR
ncbi:MAG: hypothetical protein ACRCYO_15460 [Bacteroidia bacterium]